MSLGVVIKGPEGVVLACDSRVTLAAERPGGPQHIINFDNATKLLSFSGPHHHVGAVTYGVAVIGSRTAHSFVPEFEYELEVAEAKRLEVREYADRLSEFFLRQWKKGMPADSQGQSMVFVLGGYGPQDPYGKVFLIQIPNHPEPLEQQAGVDEFGMTWGGQGQIASRLIQGYDPILPEIIQAELKLEPERVEQLLRVFHQRLEFAIPWQVLPLQDCVDLAVFMVRTTIGAQNLSIGLRGVGGPIDVAVITRTDGLRYIRRKEIGVDSIRS